MRRHLHPFLASLVLLTFFACAQQEEGERVELAASNANVVMLMPVSTSSADALNHFMRGQRELDMGRSDEALTHFEAAVAADPDFAFGYLRVANTANSLETFRQNLDMASERIANASEAERLQIEYTRKGFDNDVTGQLETAQRLVEAQPNSPRAWMLLANAQSGMGNETEARASMTKAAELSASFASAHMALGNSYLFVEPRDLDKALEHMQKAVELEPAEAVSHDLLGDAYRARGELEQAAAEYTRTAELDPSSGNGYQQRAHVHSFLGNLDQARADYDAAIALATGNTVPAFGVYRALVNVHAGDGAAAVEELNQLVESIDGMGTPDPASNKIFALNSAIQIALHHNLIPQAEAAIERRDALLTQQAETAGTEAASRQARATVALTQGYLAAQTGDHAAARAKAAEFIEIMQPSTDPLRDQPAHGLLGYVSVLETNYAEAISHFEEANPNDPYMMYHHALALDGAGQTAEAKALFAKVANYNFNSPGLALVRKDASARAN